MWKLIPAPAAALWALLATVAFGAQPVIQAPSEPIAANLATGLPVVGESDFRGAVQVDGDLAAPERATVRPAQLYDARLDKLVPGIWFWATESGSYTIIATSPDWQSGQAIVQVGDEPPPPPPTKAVYLWLVHESGDSTPEMATVRDNKTWKDAADKAGLDWLTVDDDELVKLEPAIAKAARERGLPAVLLLDKDKVVVEAVAMPGVDGMCDLVSKYTPKAPPKAPPVKRQPAARAPHR